jgi:hypothetical protein
MNVQCGAFGNKLAVYYSGSIGGGSASAWQAIFATWLSSAGEISFHAIPSCRVKIDLKTPTSITSHNSLQHVTILLNKPDETAKTFNTMLSLFSCDGLQHKL